MSSASEVFSSRGFDGATMDEIASRAKVEKANIYYYYKGKEQLYRALFERLLGELESQTAAIAGLAAEDAETAVFAFVDVLFAAVEKYQHIVGLAFDEMLHERPQAGRMSIDDLLGRVEIGAMRLLQQAMKRGRIAEADAAQLVITIEGMLLGYFMLPKARIQALTGGAKFAQASLAARKRALTDHIRRLLR